MEQIGYSLVDAQGSELQFWGDTAGRMQGPPDVIRLPNGDDVHCPQHGVEYEGAKLVPRWLQSGVSSSTMFDGEKVLVTRPAPQAETVAQKLAIVGLSVDDLKSALGVS